MGSENDENTLVSLKNLKQSISGIRDMFLESIGMAVDSEGYLCDIVEEKDN